MKESSRRLRVLVVDEYLPYPPDSGKPIRTGNLLQRLSQRHDVKLLCYGSGSGQSESSIPGLRVEFVEPLIPHAGLSLYWRLAANLLSPFPYTVEKHYTARFHARFNDLVKNGSYDLIQCEWTPYARYLNAVRSVPTVIATHNVESQIWERRSAKSSNALSRLFFGMQAAKMESFEKDTLKKASWVTAVTEEDAGIMREWGVDRVSIVDNGVDLDFYQPDPSTDTDHEMLFLASLDWEPNIDALDHFLTHILPSIVAKEPRARLTIAGRKPSTELRRRVEGTANVNFVGEVPDVRPLLKQADVIVVPLRVGGGSRLKILEGMAAGKAIVSTSVGAEGLSVLDGQQIKIADSPRDFSAAVLELMASPEMRRKLGANGRTLVEQKYGWDESANKLESAWFKAIEIGPSASAGSGAAHE